MGIAADVQQQVEHYDAPPPYAAWPAEGLSLQQALLKTADPNLKTSFERAEKALKAAGGRFGRRVKSPGMSEALLRRMQEEAHRDQIESEVDRSKRALLVDLHAQFVASRLIGTGSRSTPTAPRAMIPIHAWNDLRFSDLNRSIVAESTREATHWYGVSVLPLLHSPARADVLPGMSLKQAFRQFVLDDPEVAARAKEALVKSPEFVRVLRDGHFTVAGEMQWRMDVPLDYPGFIFRNGEGPIGCLADPPPRHLIEACDPLHDRAKAFFAIFRSQELSVRAIAAAGGATESVIHTIWSHNSFYFHAPTGNISQVNLRAKDHWDFLRRRWIAGMIERPADRSAHPTSPERAQANAGRAKVKPRRKTQSDEILKIARQASVNIFDDEVSIPKVASMLAPRMSKRIETESQLRAFEKALYRLRRSKREGDV